MKKKLLVFLTVLCLSALMAVNISASTPRLYDGADLLDVTEEAIILDRLDALSDTYAMDIVIVTADSTGEKSPMEFADDYFDYNDFGYNTDGIVLLVSMAERDYWISTTGKCIDIFYDSYIENMCNNIVFYLSDGDYYYAFDAFINDCEYYINGELYGYPFDVEFSLIVAAIVGLIAAFIVTGSMKSQLKSVRARNEASSYVKQGSFKLTAQNDFFLYKTVRRTEKPQNTSSGSHSSTHTSSSGRSHGGGGGKF